MLRATLHTFVGRAAVVFLFASSFLLSVVDARAGDAEARRIMAKVEDRDNGDKRTTKMEMSLIDKRGNKRVRRIRTHRKDKGADTLKLMFFLHPPDVRNAGFMTYDYGDPDRDDDQWLYLPALRKSKRIASTDKSKSFMGSDFTYSDMTSRDLEDYSFRIIGTQTVSLAVQIMSNTTQIVNGETRRTSSTTQTADEVATWLIEAKPRNEEVIRETGYTNSLLFITQDSFVVVRAVHFVKQGGRLKYMQVRKLVRIDGIWIATETHMTTKKDSRTLHKTILVHSDVKYGQDLDDSFFTVRRLEKGL